MFRFLFTLAIGLGAGYYLGWTDHTKNERHILERLQERAGGSARSLVKSNTDSVMNSVVDSGGARPAAPAKP
jgi:Flp pilus assembly protein TadB